LGYLVNLYPLGQTGLTAVIFLVTTPFLQVIVTFFGAGAGVGLGEGVETNGPKVLELIV